MQSGLIFPVIGKYQAALAVKSDEKNTAGGVRSVSHKKQELT